MHTDRAAWSWQIHVRQSSLESRRESCRRSSDGVCDWQRTEEVKGHSGPWHVAHTCPKLVSLYSHSHIIRRRKEGKRRPMRWSLVQYFVWPFPLGWKTMKSFLLAFLYPFCQCFSPSLVGSLSYPQRNPVWSRRVPLFRISSSKTSGVPSSLTHQRELPPFFFTEKKNHRLSLPLLPTRNQTHSASCTKDNIVIHEFKMASMLSRLCRVQICCEHMDHAECKLWQRCISLWTVAIIVIHSKSGTQWRGIQPGTWLTHTVSLPGFYG